MSAQASIPTSTFPHKGTIQAFSFPKLLLTLHQQQATGSLYVLAGQTKKIVYFVDGMPVFVRSNRVSECLGQILADEGLITQKQCDHTLETLRRTGRKQGELFVEMGILSPANIRYGLETQLRKKLFDIFTWTEGRFQFNPGPLQVPRISGFPQGSMAHVIVWGIKTSFSCELAVQGLASMLAQFPAKCCDEQDVLISLSLPPDELTFYERLNAHKSVQELLDTTIDSMHAPLPWVAPLLLGLIAAELVELRAERSEIVEPPLPRSEKRPTFTPEELKPNFAQVSSITEFEDTPLPQQIQRLATQASSHSHSSALSQADEDMFARASLPPVHEQEHNSEVKNSLQGEFLTDDLFASRNGEIGEQHSDAHQVLDDFLLGEIDEDLLIHVDAKLWGIQEIELDDELLHELQQLPWDIHPPNVKDENKADLGE